MSPKQRTLLLALSVLLAAATLAVFWPATGFEFLTYDDNAYVRSNPHVQSGWTLRSIKWAFATAHESYWIPLTWISYMADREVFGPGPRGHHLTNILLHAVNVLLVLWALHRMTGSVWRSALAAALFALHPLRVESVAWITERKDVLSTLFWMAGLVAYARYVERPRPMRYGVVFLCMALGLLAKPMLVTFPFALLLLDYWPLGRFGRTLEDVRARAGRLVLEKLPLILLSVLGSVVVYRTQQANDVVYSLAQVPLARRILQATTSYGFYLAKAVWPSRLSVVYADRHGVFLAELAVAGALLAIVTILALRMVRKRPYFAVGWLWFLGTLVPVIGVVRLGTAHVADRFTYVPLLGLFVLAAWGAADLAAALRFPKAAAAACAVLVAGACGAATRAQLRYWRSSETLFRHALDVAGPHAVAYGNLALVMENQGRLEEALAFCKASLRADPRSIETLGNTGNMLRRLGRHEEAVSFFAKALRISPDNAQMHNNLGAALAEMRRWDEAAENLQRALELNPGLVDARFNLGMALLASGRRAEAIEHLEQVARTAYWDAHAQYLCGRTLLGEGRAEEAVSYLRQAAELERGSPRMLAALGLALVKSGRREEGLRRFRHALRLDPQSVDALNNLAWILATDAAATPADREEAVTLAESAARWTGGEEPSVLDTLAAACAAAGRHEEAVRTAERAIALAEARADYARAGELQKRLAIYRERGSWVEP